MKRCKLERASFRRRRSIMNTLTRDGPSRSKAYGPRLGSLSRESTSVFFQLGTVSLLPFLTSCAHVSHASQLATVVQLCPFFFYFACPPLPPPPLTSLLFCLTFLPLLSPSTLGVAHRRFSLCSYISELLHRLGRILLFSPSFRHMSP